MPDGREIFSSGEVKRRGFPMGKSQEFSEETGKYEMYCKETIPSFHSILMNF